MDYNNTPAPAPVNVGGSSKKIITSFFEIFETFAICTVVIILIFCYVARLSVVDGESMEDTLHSQDYLIVQDLFYTPKRGDVVVLHKIDSQYSDPLIKRIIAVEGDTVDIKMNDEKQLDVYVNGTLLDEPYINEEDSAYLSSAHLTFPVTVGEDMLFVMGDHRNHSADSRLKSIGLVDERCVVGKAVLRVLPFSSFGVIKSAEYED